jgi:hypothetical protein
MNTLLAYMYHVNTCYCVITFGGARANGAEDKSAGETAAIS